VANRRFSLNAVTGGQSALPLFLMFGLAVVDDLDRAAFGVLLPEIRDWFGVSITTVVTLQSVAAVLTVLAAVPVGFLADRANRVRITAFGAVLFGLMALVTGVAPTILVLAAGRLGSGIAKTVAPAQSSLLADTYPPDRRAGVFSMFSSAEAVGRFFGPIAAGWLGAAIWWGLPFVLVSVPSLVIGVLCVTTLREPRRGEAEGLVSEGPPPGFTESWRMAKGVRTLRRIWWALPFLVGAATALVGLMSLLFDEVFDVSAGLRGTLIAANEPFRIAGLAVGAVIGNRLLERRPSRIITFVGLLASAQALSFLVVAVAPNWQVAVIPFWLGSFAGAILAPSLISLITLVIPPRVRGFALGVGAFFVAPGIIIAVPMGVLGDTWGLRWGIAAAVPVLLIGSLIITSAAVSVDADIRQAKASASALAAGRGEEAALLTVRDLDVHYGGVQVIFNVDLDVRRGEILALLGTNGAGKSTVLRAICGTALASNGAIAFEGEDITFMPPAVHAARGIVCLPGGKSTIPSLTVDEHLKLAIWALPDDLKKDAESRLEEVMGWFPALEGRRGLAAGELSGGEQQMLGLACALLLRPQLLLIDELSLGLAPVVVEQLLDIVRKVHAQGVTIVLVEQSINVAYTIADRAVFMEKGEVRFIGEAAELLSRPDILRSVFLSGGGGGGKIALRGRVDTSAPPILEVNELTKRYGGVTACDHVDLALREGTITGLIGPNGSGKTTLFDLISGTTPSDGGRVVLLGDEVTDLPLDARAKKGLHRCFQDARLFPALTVTEIVQLACERHLETRSATAAALYLPNVRRAERRVKRRADRLIEMLNLGAMRDSFARELSTGSRRVVDLACVLAAEPTLLLLDEPAAGIAQAETEALGPLLERVRFETGCTMLVIEHDMPLLRSIVDELIALDRGQVIATGLPDDVLGHPLVVESYLGASDAAINRSGAVARSNRS
jgi:branched-chain amino acid transport system ATP-binding protein